MESTLCDSLGSEDFVTLGNISLNPFTGVDVLGLGLGGHGAKSRMETVDSRPSGYLTLAYIGFTSTRSTWFTNGSCLLDRTNCRTNTGPGVKSHDGNELPVLEHC